MKKLLLTVITTCLVTLSIAQKSEFKLSPTGFVDKADTTKNYLVLEIPGKSQEDLYKQSLIYFSSKYVSPNDVISKVDNEVLTINGVEKGAVRENKIATPFNMNYTIVFKFKDGRVKIESPSFRLNVGLREKYLVYTGFSMDGKESGIFGKNNKVKSERAIEDLENYFKNYISEYHQAITARSSEW